MSCVLGQQSSVRLRLNTTVTCCCRPPDTFTADFKARGFISEGRDSHTHTQIWSPTKRWQTALTKQANTHIVQGCMQHPLTPNRTTEPPVSDMFWRQQLPGGLTYLSADSVKETGDKTSERSAWDSETLSCFLERNSERKHVFKMSKVNLCAGSSCCQRWYTLSQVTPGGGCYAKRWKKNNIILLKSLVEVKPEKIPQSELRFVSTDCKNWIKTSVLVFFVVGIVLIRLTMSHTDLKNTEKNCIT